MCIISSVHFTCHKIFIYIHVNNIILLPIFIYLIKIGKFPVSANDMCRGSRGTAVFLLNFRCQMVVSGLFQDPAA